MKSHFFTIVISDQMVGYWMGMLRCYPMFRQTQDNPSRPANLNVLGGNWSRIGRPKTSRDQWLKRTRKNLCFRTVRRSIFRDRRFIGISGECFFRLNLRNPKPSKTQPG